MLTVLYKKMFPKSYLQQIKKKNETTNYYLRVQSLGLK
jgi:hypothetical protein